VMLDEFVYGEVARVSPEAPSLVIVAERSEIAVGGAGNVARNIASLGAHCIFVGVVGDDEAGRSITKAFARELRITPRLVVDASRPSTRKVRFVSEHHSTHLLRADWETTRPIAPEVEEAVLEAITDVLRGADAVVLSDYAKGTLTPAVIHRVIASARERRLPIIVDPKGTDFAVYRGATLITPNRKELAEAVRLPVGTDEEIAAAAAKLAEFVNSEAVLVTRSEDGITLHVRSQAPVHIPAHPVRIRDVSGAGDTVAAVLATIMATGGGFEPAARAANAAAAVVVGKRGTATVSPAELRARIVPHAVLACEEKIVFDRVVLEDYLLAWRRLGLRIGFTNGCFDLLHPGHVRLLTEARALCDRLVVGLNSDRSVAGLKGPGRPIQDQQARAEVLAALEAVDLVVVFDEAKPLELIRQVRPRVLVKGAEYRLNEVVGGDLVAADGGEVVLVDLVPGYSTTRLVDQSRVRQQG
jgi:D-beta-D-heptose 7-phosphate kinase / D-beta-D-heptose 1-phosphate adenosyltransferase